MTTRPRAPQDPDGPAAPRDRDEAVELLANAEDLLLTIVRVRRSARYRELLVQGTGLDGRITTMRVLRAVADVARDGGRASVTEVAERLVIEHSSASRAVEQVVAAGLLEKRQSSRDGRRVELVPTPRGTTAIRELDARRRAVHTAVADGWRDEELVELERLLTRLSASYQKLTAGD